MAIPCDILIPGFNNDHVMNMRLWTARASRELDLSFFSRGDYIGAVKSKVSSETISKVLYPPDHNLAGQELRLKQQYFFVAATFQDIMRRYKKKNSNFDDFSDKIAVQLNDTHPSIAIPELMRLLLDTEGLNWEKAWDICVHTFAYTNHTLMPEALEKWTVEMMGKVLPRHLDIIYEINRRFLDHVKLSIPVMSIAYRLCQLLKKGRENNSYGPSGHCGESFGKWCGRITHKTAERESFFIIFMSFIPVSLIPRQMALPRAAGSASRIQSSPLLSVIVSAVSGLRILMHCVSLNPL